MPMRNFNSKLRNHFINLIEEQKVLNYSISFIEYIFWDFDKFIISNNFNDGVLSRELVDAWSMQRINENLNTRNSRLYPIRLLAKYLLVLGIEAYIPGKQGSTEYATPYIPTRKELKIFFQTIDLWHHSFHYLNYTELIYPVIFRLYYCLGLRLNEVVCLKIDEVDLTNGSLYIRHSKGDKDRIVYVSADLLELLKIYNKKIEKCCNRERYFFPGCSNMKIDAAKKMSKTSIDAKMKYFWKLSFPQWIGKRPTVHCLRYHNLS